MKISQMNPHSAMQIQNLAPPGGTSKTGASMPAAAESPVAAESPAADPAEARARFRADSDMAKAAFSGKAGASEAPENVARYAQNTDLKPPGEALTGPAAEAARNEAYDVLRGAPGKGQSTDWRFEQPLDPTGPYQITEGNRYLTDEQGNVTRLQGRFDNHGSQQGDLTMDKVFRFEDGTMVHGHKPGSGSGSVTVLHPKGGEVYKIDNLRTEADWNNAFQQVQQYENARQAAPGQSG